MYKKKRKKIEKKKILYISLVVIFLIIGFIVNIMVTDRNLSVFEKAIRDSVLSIEKIGAMPFHFISNKIKDAQDKSNMLKDYQSLKEENTRLQGLEDANQELQFQLEEMKKLLEINESLSDYNYIHATVTGRSLQYWDDTITLDKGEYSGITVGMPVVVGNGLIGKVIKTSTFFSTVRLLTASSTDNISVKIKTSSGYVYGILKRSNNTYIMEGIPQNVDIEQGQKVVTTGMGDIFPSGIVVGEVTGITTDAFDLEKVLEVKLGENFDAIDYVTILKRKAS